MIKKQQIQDKINKFIEQEKIGAAIRCKTQYYEEVEKNSRFFIHLEKQRGDKKNMKVLKSNTGILLTMPEKIQNQQKQFHKNLYTSSIKANKNIQQLIDAFFSGLERPVLEGDDGEALGKPITEEGRGSMNNALPE